LLAAVELAPAFAGVVELAPVLLAFDSPIAATGVELELLPLECVVLVVSEPLGPMTFVIFVTLRVLLVALAGLVAFAVSEALAAGTFVIFVIFNSLRGAVLLVALEAFAVSEALAAGTFVIFVTFVSLRGAVLLAALGLLFVCA
jgi:hypothetical protein